MEIPQTEIIELLQSLIVTQSFSKEEFGTASIIAQFFQSKNIPSAQVKNNVWAKNLHFDLNKPTLLLNSHHDTVKPNKGYQRDPFAPTIEGDKLYGLGSNDAGGAVVCLINTFCYFYEQQNLPYNIVIALTAEEEISGNGGIEFLLPQLPPIDLAIVGEPTQMQPAIAEKGLMVLDCVAYGQSGHAAREEGDNAIYKAIKDIEWFNSYQFEKISPLIGPVKMSVTLINAGTQHNVVPDTCNFVVDIRINENYTHQAILDVIKKHVSSQVNPRSMRLSSSGTPADHLIVKTATDIGLTPFGSPTSSDQALLPMTSIKIGPGNSSRSHSADEFIYLSDLVQGIDIYKKLLNHFFALAEKQPNHSL